MLQMRDPHAGSFKSSREDRRLVSRQSQTGIWSRQTAHSDLNVQAMEKKDKKADAKTEKKKAVKVMSLEGEEEETAETVDENAEVKRELDDLRAEAMAAMGNLPETAPESIRAIAKGDYDALLNYLDQVAADTTRLPHGNAVPAGDADAEEAVAEKGKAMALKSVKKTKFASLKKLGKLEVVLALDEAVRSPLNKIAKQLKDANNDAERSNIVLQGLSNARINALEILDMPSAAAMAAEEDLEDAKTAQMKRQVMKGLEMQLAERPTMLAEPSSYDTVNEQEENLAINEMKGIPRYSDGTVDRSVLPDGPYP